MSRVLFASADHLRRTTPQPLSPTFPLLETATDEAHRQPTTHLPKKYTVSFAWPPNLVAKVAYNPGLVVIVGVGALKLTGGCLLYTWNILC